jgi:hypothetical protein
MERSLVLLLMIALATGLCNGQAGTSVRERMHAIAPNSPVEVRFRDGSKLRGWVGEVSDSGFVLDHEIKHQKHQLQHSQFTFDSVRDVRAVKSVNPRHTTRNILIGVGIAVLVIGGLLAAAAASAPLVH